MAIKYVLFDFDGTLIDSNEAVISCLHLAAEHYRGTPFDPDELDGILGKPLEEQMAFLSYDQRLELVQFYRTAYRKVRDDLTKSYDGVDEMLKNLKSMDLKIGIVSNKGRSGIDHGIDMFHMQDVIDVSISKDDVTLSKPDPEGIFKALEALIPNGTALSDAIKETIFVGDSGHDIESGQNAGCRTILVAWTLIDLERLKRMDPDFVAETPAEITAYIKNHQ